jgi:hypothetical protein
MKADFSDILSSSEFDCLDFHDPSKLNQHEKTHVAQCVRNLTFLLLKDIGYEHHYIPAEKTIREGLQTWSEENMMHLIPEKRQALQEIMNLGAGCGEYFYHLCQDETKLVIAIVTTIMIASDDGIVLSSDIRDGLSYYSCNQWQNLPQVNDRCTALTKAHKMSTEYFGSQDPLVGGMFSGSFGSYIDACAHEARMEYELPLHLGNHGASHPLSEGCSVESFPSYFRASSGVPLVYIISMFKVSRHEEIPLRLWTPLIPDMIIFIDYINDLISCPKELLAGETWGYLSMQTQTKRQAGRPSKYKSKKDGLWTFRDTLCETLQQVQSVTLSLDQAFTQCIEGGFGGSAQDGKSQIHEDLQLADRLWKGFRNGYISWHVNCKRYDL